MRSEKNTLAALQVLIDKGVIEKDPVQFALARRLGELQEKVKKSQKLFSWLGRGVPLRGVPPLGLYIHGDVGRGKSMLMELFFETTAIRKKQYIHFHEFMAETHADIFRLRQANVENPIEEVALLRAKNAKLLCFDEFQINDIGDASILGRLFASLFAHKVIVVATSNTPIEKLYEGGLHRERIVPALTLLQENMESHDLCGERDYRYGQLSNRKLWFSLRERAEQNALFAEMTKNMPAPPLTLSVEDRCLVLPRACGSIAAISFEALCGQAFWTRDYEVLAGTIDTLFIEEIPHLGKGKPNHAARFTALIDILYEHRVKLVCSAEGAVEGLYPEGEGKRTISRIVEMQSDSYLKTAWKKKH